MATASAGHHPQPGDRIDLHTHSEVSDGTDTPTQLVAAAAQAGLSTIALTDHDTFAGIAEALAAGSVYGVQVLAGVEISTELNGISVHLLGYGADPEEPGLAAALEQLRRSRADRTPQMLAALAALGMPIDPEILRVEVGESPSVGRPHIADAMIKHGYVTDRGAAFDGYLAVGGPAYVPRFHTPLRQAVDLVHKAGGVAVIAHPWSRQSWQVLDERALFWLARDHRLDGIEVDHHDHSVQTRAELRRIAGRVGLLATGSSDYHGTGKVDHDLGSNTTSAAVLTEILARIS
ncbi:MAG: PHP domain-containing protein [Propionibacteriaceae bacterium]|jgi:predicted metal-dependent phosphoesterase TrpH|nr:PHP domain-containing protein [Propionibacteriaceae bacterium]